MTRSRMSHPYYRLRGKASDVSQMLRESVSHQSWQDAEEDQRSPQYRVANEPMVQLVIIAILIAACLISSVAVILLMRSVF